VATWAEFANAELDLAAFARERMARTDLRVAPPVTARPGQTPNRLVHYACSIEEAVATEYTDDVMLERR